MSENLYFKSNAFTSKRELAARVYEEFLSLSLQPEEPVDEDYMFVVTAYIDAEPIDFYMGKNDEESSPPLWQIWPQQRIGILKRIFGKPDKKIEFKARKLLEESINKMDSVSDVEWGI